MSDWIPIEYRDFWDVPRIFLTTYRGQRFLFNCPFNERDEDFGDTYQVSLLPRLSAEALAGSWEALPGLATDRLGEVPIARVRFDPTRRQKVEAELLDELLRRRLRPGGKPDPSPTS